MSAVTTIESLLKLGIAVQDAVTKAAAVGIAGMPAFLGSPEFKVIEVQVTDLLSKLKPNDLTTALATVQAKKAALLGGKPVSDLSSEQLTQYFALLRTEGLLVRQELKNAAKTPSFFDWLLDTAVPTLVPIVKVVVPLLL